MFSGFSDSTSASSTSTSPSPRAENRTFGQPNLKISDLNLNLSTAMKKNRDFRGPSTQVERDSVGFHNNAEEEEILQLSDSDSSSSSFLEDDFSPTSSRQPKTKTLSGSNSSKSKSSKSKPKGLLPPDEDDLALLPDDITKDLYELQQLRQSVKKNLRLRPIRSRGNLPKVDISAVINRSVSGSSQGQTGGAVLNSSPTSSIASSYFTPSSETPFTAFFTPPGTGRKLEFQTSQAQFPPPPPLSSNSTSTLSSEPPPAPSITTPQPLSVPPPSTTIPTPANTSTPCSVSAKSLYTRLISAKRPLLIDTRPLAVHQSFHIRHSINIAIPSLILKRCRKPGGGLPSLDSLKQFTTTERGKAQWEELMHVERGVWDGDVVVYDDEMDVRDKDNLGVTAWAIIPIIVPLLIDKGGGSVDYLEGGISSAGHHPDLETLVVSGEEADLDTPPANATGFPNSFGNAQVNGSVPGTKLQKKKSGGLLQIDTLAAFRSKKLPEIEPSSTVSLNPPSPGPLRSPLPIMPGTTRLSSNTTMSSNSSFSSGSQQQSVVQDHTPSPPPSSVAFRRPVPPRRPSVPNLRKIDTRSPERLNISSLPKLSVRTKPIRSATLGVPPLTINLPQSPSHLNLMYSNHSPPHSATRLYTPISPSHDPANYLTPYYTPPHTPGTPRAGAPPITTFFPPIPASPHTARPELDPPTTDDAFPPFTISTILPGFLFLGPELTLPEHVSELKELGVKRILNIAAECDDDNGLMLKQVFDKYFKIPMRDTVEEENIAKGVKEVCEILDDARLHSSATYVHCKAGKSRSVTAVMAYLIHANHWTLSRAYAFVMERRKGISPNIGFVSVLMSFEEQELGGKSIGVQPTTAMTSANHPMSGASGTSVSASADGHGTGVPDNYALASGASRRGGHVRESLPPTIGNGISINIEGIGGGVSGSGVAGPMSAGGLMERVMNDSGQEMEIKDAEGRYRHARRAPVDETTLQPMRRVSKAGLESSAYS